MADYEHRPYTFVRGKDDKSWELQECSYDPTSGQHTLGAVVATGTLEDVKEIEEML